MRTTIRATFSAITFQRFLWDFCTMTANVFLKGCMMEKETSLTDPYAVRDFPTTIPAYATSLNMTVILTRLSVAEARNKSDSKRETS